MEGKLGGAKFYTNSWPNFSAIVCQWEYPKVSDVKFLLKIITMTTISRL